MIKQKPMQTLFKDINTVVGLTQTDVVKDIADLVVAYLRKFVFQTSDAFKRMDVLRRFKENVCARSKSSRY